MEQAVNYSLLSTKQNTHEDGIWGLACGLIKGESSDSISGEKTEVILTGGVDGIIKMWKFDDNELDEIRAKKGHELGVVSIDINNEGTMIVSSAMNASLRLWDAASFTPVGSIHMSSTSTCNVAFTADTRFVITGSRNGKLLMYNIQNKIREFQLRTRGKFLHTVAASNDGKYVASGDSNGVIYVFEYATGDMIHSIEGHERAVRSIQFSPDSKMLLSASEDHLMKLFDVDEGREIAQIPGHSSWVVSATFSHDGRCYASASLDNSVKVWDISNHHCLHTFDDHQDAVWAVRFNSNSNRLVSVSKDQSVRLYGIPSYMQQ